MHQINGTLQLNQCPIDPVNNPRIVEENTGYDTMSVYYTALHVIRMPAKELLGHSTVSKAYNLALDFTRGG